MATAMSAERTQCVEHKPASLLQSSAECADDTSGLDKVVVRDFELSDMKLLLRLDQLMCSELQGAGRPELTAYPEPWWRARLAPDRRSYLHWRGCTLVYRGVPCGMCVLSKCSRSTGTARTKRRRVGFAELFWIAIEDSLRGKGLGSSLLGLAIGAAQKWWPGISEVRLHVLSNARAVQFYSKCGFEVVESKANYPEPGYESLRMVRGLLV